MQRVAPAVACLANLAAGCSNAAVPGPPANLQVMVLDCYTRSDVRVLIDGRPLALIPPERREDSLGVCHNGPVAFGAEARIDIQSRGQTRRLVVRPDGQSRYLLINPVVAPYAELTREAPLLD